MSTPTRSSRGGVVAGGPRIRTLRNTLLATVAVAASGASAWAQPRPQCGVDITKCPPAYHPTLGNTVTFTAVVWDRMPPGPCSSGSPGVIHFALYSVSSERGTCLNVGTRTHTDLHFNTPENAALFVPVESTTADCDLVGGPHAHWFHVKTNVCVGSATVTVKSEDFGSYGWIRAWVEFPAECPMFDVDVVTFLPRETPASPPSCVVGPATAKVPRDDNGNDIADTWAYDATNGTSPIADGETNPYPSDLSQGDGLTRYEEWRGLSVVDSGAPAHTRLNGNMKELFVYRTNTAYGVEDAGQAAMVRYVSADGMNGAAHDGVPGTVNPALGPRIINFNRTSHKKADGPQHGLWLDVVPNAAGHRDRGDWGVTFDNNGGTAGAIGSPEKTGRVFVFHDNITRACPNEVGALIARYGPRRQRGGAQFSYDARARAVEMIRDTIGHEVGHGINLEHHKTVRITIDHAPGDDAEGWIDVNSAPRSITRDWLSADVERNCVMNYPYHEIYQAVALDFANGRVPRWQSRDPDWTPHLAVCALGYGAACASQVTGAGGASIPCRRATIIDDGDN